MKRALVLVLAIGCGDSQVIDPVYAAQSGTRLALQMYRFDDGTEQPEPGSFYDTVVHSRCTAQKWIDGETRCVPIAEDAVYADAACTTFVGRAMTMPKPTAFLNYEYKDNEYLPAHALRAGAATAPITEYFAISDGMCEGPFTTPSDLSYFAIAGEYEGSELVPLHDDEVGEGRLGLQVHLGDDGVRVPFGFRDRDLDLACTPEVLPDGTARCAPGSVPAASQFLDRDCTVPAYLMTGPAAPPPVVTTLDPSGCTSFHRLGAVTAGPVYALADGTCRQITPGPGRTVYAVGDAIDALALERSLVEVAGRRLEPIVLADGALRFYDARIYDSATRADCALAQVGDVPRCMPVNLATASTLYDASCSVEVPVVGMPVQSCSRPAFAQYFTTDAVELRAIGEPVTTPLFQGFPGQCQMYTSPPGTEVRALGPPLDPTAFEGAIYYGAR